MAKSPIDPTGMRSQAELENAFRSLDQNPFDASAKSPPSRGTSLGFWVVALTVAAVGSFLLAPVSQVFAGLAAFLLFVLGLLLYFAPTVVARRRGHAQVLPIFVLNLTLGWMVIGWIVALVWALSAKAQVVAEIVQTRAPDPEPRWTAAGMKKCPYCAEDVRAEAIKCKHCGSDLGAVGKAA